MAGDGRVPYQARPSLRRRIVRDGLIIAILILFAGLAAISGLFFYAGRTPREWAAELRRDAPRQGPIVRPIAIAAADWLQSRDHLAIARPRALPAALGASAERSGSPPADSARVVASIAALRDAVATAQPGGVIVLQAGVYPFAGPAILFTRPGAADAPIVLRAVRVGDAVIESDAIETFKVLAPFWHFENLVMRGVCADHSQCEHAIHIAGAATDTVVRNSRFEDYNAHLKINGEDGNWPDRGVIEGNSFSNTVPRVTRNPITPIDLVGASGWRATGNIIADFARGIDGGATYGAFFKGAGEGNIFERNLVVCAWNLTDAPGQRVGLSLGGGATDPTMRRDQGRTGFEQVGGVIRDNLIAFCSDDGIYLNRAARSEVDHNTLLDTAGIDGRFVETSATVTANVVDGAIRGRDGGSVRGWDNDYPFLLGLFLGWHPQRGLFQAPGKLDLDWRDAPDDVPDTEDRTDLCGRPRSGPSRPGAFQDFSACGAGE
jgi:hypothetical protein